MLLKHWSLLKCRRLVKLSPQQKLGVDTPNTRQKLLLLTSARVWHWLHSELLIDRGTWSPSYSSLLLEKSMFKEEGVGSI